MIKVYLIIVYHVQDVLMKIHLVYEYPDGEYFLAQFVLIYQQLIDTLWYV